MNPKLVLKLGMLLVARVMYGLQQWICLAVIARYGDAAGVGYFGLGLALVVPIMGFAGMGLRQGVATDVAALYSFRDYWIFRVVSLFVASGIVYGLAIGIHEEPVVLISVVSVLIPKAIELLSDLSYGYFQKAGDYDKISISLGVRAITGAVAFSIAFILTRSILVACLAWGAVWFLVFLVYDFPVARHAMQRDPQPVGRRAFSFLTFWKMLVEHFPLGLAGLIGNAGVSAPRMIYDRFTTPANLGIFTALTMAYQSVNLLFGTLLQNSLTPLSAAINARQPAATAKLVRASAAATGAVSLLIVVMTFFAGNQMFGLVYGSRFVGYGVVASMLSIGWAARYVSTIFRYVATAERKFWTGIGLDTLCAAAIAIGCLVALLVDPSMISLSIGFTLGQLAALAVVLMYALVAIRRLNAA